MYIRQQRASQSGKLKSHRIVKMMSWENNREKLKLIKIIIKIRQHLIITYLINYTFTRTCSVDRSNSHSWESVYNQNLLNWMNSFCWWMMIVWKVCRHVQKWAEARTAVIQMRTFWCLHLLEHSFEWVDDAADDDDTDIKWWPSSCCNTYPPTASCFPCPSTSLTPSRAQPFSFSASVRCLFQNFSQIVMMSVMDAIKIYV